MCTCTMGHFPLDGFCSGFINALEPCLETLGGCVANAVCSVGKCLCVDGFYAKDGWCAAEIPSQVTSIFYLFANFVLLLKTYHFDILPSFFLLNY